MHNAAADPVPEQMVNLKDARKEFKLQTEVCVERTLSLVTGKKIPNS